MTRCPIPGCAANTTRVYDLPLFSVARCDQCGVMFRDPPPTDADVRRMYNDSQYHDSAYFADRTAADRSRHPEIAIFESALGTLEPRRASLSATTRPRILDVGCGSGVFLKLAAAAGWTATGVELSCDLAARGRREDIEIIEGDFAGLDALAGSFHAITMWDFLEHVVDPVATLRRAHDLLAPRGILVVFTINSASLFNVVGDLAYRVTAGRWTRANELLYDERHCFFFTEASLNALLAKTGFHATERRTFRAHLSRWLSRPVALPVRAASEIIDLCSIVARRPYRQLVFAETQARVSC